MAEGDTEPDDVVVGVGERVALKGGLTEVHLLELVRSGGYTLGGDLVQGVVLNLAKAVQSACHIPGYDLVNNRLSPCEDLSGVSGGQAGKVRLGPCGNGLGLTSSTGREESTGNES